MAALRMSVVARERAARGMPSRRILEPKDARISWRRKLLASSRRRRVLDPQVVEQVCPGARGDIEGDRHPKIAVHATELLLNVGRDREGDIAKYASGHARQGLLSGVEVV